MILSICIPSYNRFEELNKLLYSIAQAKSRDFNVFIIDNGSKEDLNNIKIVDERFHLIKRSYSVPGATSIRTSLDFGDGKYRMLCLDKDFIFGEYLDQFVEKLKKHDVACGYCLLNSEEQKGGFTERKCLNGKSFYRGGHPSGYFLREDILKKDMGHINAYDETSPFYNNAFIMDLLYAEGLCAGKEIIYYGKLVQPESAEKAKKKKSYTYSMKNNNLYFMPYGRKQQFDIYIKHIKLLNLQFDMYKKVLANLFFKTFMGCTIGYRNVMRNQDVCMHHSIECKEVTFYEMIQEAVLYSKEFRRNQNVKIGKIEKDILIISAWIRLVGIGIIIRVKEGRKR